MRVRSRPSSDHVRRTRVRSGLMKSMQKVSFTDRDHRERQSRASAISPVRPVFRRGGGIAEKLRNSHRNFIIFFKKRKAAVIERFRPRRSRLRNPVRTV